MDCALLAVTEEKAALQPKNLMVAMVALAAVLLLCMAMVVQVHMAAAEEVALTVLAVLGESTAEVEEEAPPVAQAAHMAVQVILLIKMLPLGRQLLARPIN